MILYTTTFSTPCGPFSLAVDDDAAVIATAFGDVAALLKRLPRSIAWRVMADELRTQRARDEVRAYFRNERDEFSVRLRPLGSNFQKRVWAALGRIPRGETRSYGELARLLRSGARAVGRANATNPICLFIPCHRVIGADGSLTGFAFGEGVKRQLLAHEMRAVPASRSGL